MIAGCPSCSARYRIDPGRLRAEGVRLRCTRCEAIFRVRPPAREALPNSPPDASVPVESSTSVDAVEPRSQSAVEQTPEMDRDRLVVVADPEVELGKITASTLVEWGLQSILVHDGVEAILSIQRSLPRVVVVDAALPKMFGFQVCELVKRNESLRHIHVVLVGAIRHKDRYRGSPNELYGADAYLERPELPEALGPILESWGLNVQPARMEGGGGVAPQPTPQTPVHVEAPKLLQPEPASPPTRSASPVESRSAPIEPPEFHPPSQPELPRSEAPNEGFNQEIANAKRLARIIVSDIILYNQEKFEAAIKADNVTQALQAEIAEGASLFVARIDSRVREVGDFLGDELLRVVRERRGT